MQVWIVGLGCAAGCGDSGRAESDAGTGAIVSTAPPSGQTDPGEGTVGASATTTGEGSASASASGSTTQVDTSEAVTEPIDPSAGVKLDLGVLPDVGPGETGETGEEPLPLTCESIGTQTATSVGCEFWGVDLPMLVSSEMAYGISVGNITEEPATVTIEDLRGPNGTLRQIAQIQLAPKQSQLVKVNGDGGMVPGDHAVAKQGLTDKGAFRVTSTVPVTAMQINPVGGGPSHVSEASLLLPVQALGQSYFAIDYPSAWSPWVVAVATQDGTTITTTGGEVMLDAFDTWTFVPNGPDATGFFVGADKPVGVFAGTDCVLIPGDPWYACDHLEEQIVPLAAWGKAYVGGRHPQRVPNINPQPEEVRWRVVAGVDGAQITLQPPQPGVGGAIQIAKAGQVVEFASAESFVATSDQPFMLTQFMSGCYNVVKSTGSPTDCNQGATGDPYMIQVPPIEQWMTQLPFLTDTSYPRDFAIIMREAGTVVELACLGVVSDDHFTAIPGTMYEVGSVELDDVTGEGDCVDGEQFISADKPIGVMVAGLDWATSYGYPGGLTFKSLWKPPEVPPQ